MNLFKRIFRLSSPPLFSKGALESLGADTTYRTAAPFPHLIVDNLFNPVALRLILEEWPSFAGNEETAEKHDDGTYVKKKFGTTWRTPFGPNTTEYLRQLGRPDFLQAMQSLTGIGGLMPDPYLFGGGLHATAVGGRLAVHADYNKHPVTKLDRRINLLVYLNDGWKEENGGWLELWDQSMQKCEKRVLPVFNRTVLFSTTSTSYHGQPEPICGPINLWRRSIALYYFSMGRPEEQGASADEHSTLWRERPGEGY